MNEITIEWSESDGAYIVRMDCEFIGDFESLYCACEYALDCASNSGHRVVLLAVKS
jgi:hypothetical protein